MESLMQIDKVSDYVLFVDRMFISLSYNKFETNI